MTDAPYTFPIVTGAARFPINFKKMEDVMFVGVSWQKGHHGGPGTMSDFVKQLCSGKLFFDGGWLPPAEEDAGEIDWRDLKRRAEQYLGAWHQSPEELLSSGRQKHPDFESWVNENWQ